MGANLHAARGGRHVSSFRVKLQGFKVSVTTSNM